MPARIPRRQRARIQRRSENQAAREYGPQIQAKQAEGTALQGQLGQEKQANRQAVNVARKAVGSAIRDARRSGLKGQALKDTVRELAHRKVDIASSLPALNAASKQVIDEALQQNRFEVLGLQADQATAAARIFGTRLEQARGRQRAATKAQAPEPTPPPTKGETNALASLQQALQAVRAGQVKAPDGSAIPVPRTPQEWRAFALQVQDAATGFDQTDALTAAELLQSTNPDVNPAVAGPRRSESSKKRIRRQGQGAVEQALDAARRAQGLG